MHWARSRAAHADQLAWAAGFAAFERGQRAIVPVRLRDCHSQDREAARAEEGAVLDGGSAVAHGIAQHCGEALAGCTPNLWGRGEQERSQRGLVRAGALVFTEEGEGLAGCGEKPVPGPATWLRLCAREKCSMLRVGAGPGVTLQQLGEAANGDGELEDR